MLQWNLYVPALVTVSEAVPFPATASLNDPSSAETVWAALSWLVMGMATPTFAVIGSPNEKLTILMPPAAAAGPATVVAATLLGAVEPRGSVVVGAAAVVGATVATAVNAGALVGDAAVTAGFLAVVVVTLVFALVFVTFFVTFLVADWAGTAERPMSAAHTKARASGRVEAVV